MRREIVRKRNKSELYLSLLGRENFVSLKFPLGLVRYQDHATLVPRGTSQPHPRPLCDTLSLKSQVNSNYIYINIPMI